MEVNTLVAESRTKLGTRDAREQRKRGRIPAVIYGHGESSVSISLDWHEVEVALAHGARTLDLKLEGKALQLLIKAVQHDHMDARPVHLDLMRVNLDERVKVGVSIELRGTPKGIAEGGVLDQLLNEIEVECLVTQIPETMHPFVTDLGVGDSLLIKDLEFPAGVVPLLDPEERVAMVRVVAEEAEETEAEEGEEGAGAEPERIGRVRKDEEGEGASS